MRSATNGLISLARSAFTRHQLVGCREDCWRIARLNESGKIEGAYATEIVSLWGGRLFVGGDIDDCVFAYYSDSPDHIDKLRWIGMCDDIDYVCQKAQMGMTDNGKLTTEGRGGNKGPSARVVYAWAAVRSLCGLLDATKVEREFKQTEIERGIQKERWGLTPESYPPENVCPFCHGVDCDCRIGDFEGELSGSR
jgi:hypothetical protein